MDAFDIVLAALRGLHLVALLSLFGVLVFLAMVAPAALAGMPVPGVRQHLAGLVRRSAAAALLTGVAWFAVQAAYIAGIGHLTELPDAVVTVASYTRFGHAMIFRLILLAGVVAIAAGGRAMSAAQTMDSSSQRLSPPVMAGPDPAMTGSGCHRPIARPAGVSLGLSILLTAVAIALQARIGHAGALGFQEGIWLSTSETMHLLASGAWFGALLPLLLCLRALPSAGALVACRRFSVLGMIAVPLILASAFVQGREWVGGIPALFGTAYGCFALAKLLLFAIALGFAVTNKVSLTGRLAGAAPRRARRLLLGSVSAEFGIGLLIVVVAAFLASVSPGTHQQPVWPFPWRLSLTALDEPELRQEVATALLTAGGAIAMLSLSLLARRGRIVVALAAAGVVALVAPSFGLLLLGANPASFFVSPTGFAAAGIVHGQTLFARHCVACHGAAGRGDGPAAKGLRIPPADLTAGHLADHSDGELFWWLTHGMDDPQGGLAMPGFAAALSEADRWSLIDFVHAANAGAATRGGSRWPKPVRAPAMPIACAGEAAGQLGDLRDRVVHLMTSETPPMPAPPSVDGIAVVPLLMSRTGLGKEAGPGCVVAASGAWQAYAVIAGVPSGELGGMEFLIDPKGWIRAMWRRGATPGWSNPDRFIAEIRRICAQPVSQEVGEVHVHQQ